jgi:hypothetical protein
MTRLYRLGASGGGPNNAHYESLPRKGQLRGYSDGAILRRPLQKENPATTAVMWRES